VAGFVHGVLNTDNMNITGESFDYGPWRWLPRWDPTFTAAYFDEHGLYAFGRQPEAIRWNLGQLAIALRPLVAAEPLIAALDRFGECYHANMIRRFCWRLGVASRGLESDSQLIAAAEVTMREQGIGPDEFFHRHRFARAVDGELRAALAGYQPAGDPHSFWDRDQAEAMHIEEVEHIWSAIAERDDWTPLHTKVSALHQLGQALDTAPEAAGHIHNIDAG
jgi:serine/tyrosine/threonine adenylyltransferase